MGPHADFACLSKKCQQDGAATVYDLPVGAKVCPVCGSKRLQRLYNSVMVSSGHAKKVDAIVQPAMDEATAAKSEAAHARAGHRAAPALGVPISQIGGALAKFGIPAPNLPNGGSRPSVVPAAPAFAQIAQRPPMPGPGSRRDSEYKISNGKVERA